jgi:hypothetical protein
MIDDLALRSIAVASVSLIPGKEGGLGMARR